MKKMTKDFIKLLYITGFVLLASCSDTDPDPIVVPDGFENTLPAFMINEYGTIPEQLFTEPGTIRFTADSVIVNTVNHKHAFKITKYHNYYDPSCKWLLRVNDIEYLFTTNSMGDHIWLKFRRMSDTKYHGVGTYYRDFGQEETPVNEQIIIN